MTVMTRLFGLAFRLLRLVVTLLGSERESFAQGMGGMGRGGMGGRSQGRPRNQRTGDPRGFGGERRHHAHRRSEPTLSANPLEISPEVQKQIGTDADRDVEVGGTSPKRSAPSSPPTIPRRAANTASRRFSRCGPSANSRTIALALRDASTTTGAAPSTTPTCSFRCSGICATTAPTPRSSAPSCTERPPPSTTTGWPRSSSAAPASGGYLHMPPLLTFTRHSAKGGFN